MRQTCQTDGCHKPVRFTGLCNAHWKQKREAEKAGAWPSVPEPVIVSDPDDLPVPYKDRRPYRNLWAVVVAYPEMDGGAPCQGKDFLFFPKEGKERADGDQLRQARLLCASCPIVVRCQEWALAHEAFGVWGGLTPQDRWNIRTKRGQLMVEPLYAGKSGFEDRNWSAILDKAAARQEREAC